MIGGSLEGIFGHFSSFRIARRILSNNSIAKKFANEPPRIAKGESPQGLINGWTNSNTISMYCLAIDYHAFGVERVSAKPQSSLILVPADLNLFHRGPT